MTSLRINTSFPFRDRLLALWLKSSAVVAGVLAVLVVIFLVMESWPAFRQIGPERFVTDPSWHPTAGRFGLLPMLAGTLAVTAGAIFIAIPLGTISAVFLHFYAPRRLAVIYRRVIELLAGIPSVVYGFWGLVVLVPIIASIEPPGPSLLAGIAILALMVLPTMALTADSAIASVPDEIVRGGAALGLSRGAIVRRLVLPAAKPGLATGALLATGRAIGETMAVLMVCGNVVRVPESFFDPIRTLTANIALEMAYATQAHRATLFVSGLVLTAAIIVLVAGAERLGSRSGLSAGGEAAP